MPMPKKPRSPCRNCGKTCPRPSYSYCNNKCQQDFQYKEYIRRWQAGEETGNNAGVLSEVRVARHVRRFLFEKNGNSCEQCGWSRVNPTSGLVPLTVEHVDGNATNTVESNLKLLCPNCHSLTPTYGNLNKGRGRKGRYLRA